LVNGLDSGDQPLRCALLSRNLVGGADVDGDDVAANVLPDFHRGDDVTEVVEVDLTGGAGVVDVGAELEQAHSLFEITDADDFAFGVGDFTQAVADVRRGHVDAVDEGLGDGQADDGSGVVGGVDVRERR